MLDVDGRGIYEHLFRPIIMESSLWVAVTNVHVQMYMDKVRFREKKYSCLCSRGEIKPTLSVAPVRLMIVYVCSVYPLHKNR